MSQNEFSDWLGSLQRDLDPQIFNEDTLPHITLDDTKALTWMWISEGIPYAFKDRPIKYHVFRKKLANSLNIRPSDIGLTGSARVGFSLSPCKFLNNYDSSSSDLDLFLVNQKLFDKIWTEIATWLNNRTLYKDITKGPNRFLFANIENLSSQIGRGFLDSWKVPNIAAHPETKKLHDELYKIGIYAENKGFPKIGGGIRIYKSWDAAVNQISFSINYAIQKISNEK